MIKTTEVCLIETLGERIRKLRKQQKLTLEALAGSKLTKGMLSLIENNKANPSMESLSYIADRLSVDVSDLLAEVSLKELRELLEKAEMLYHTELDELTNEYEQLITLVDPYVFKLKQGYEAARLLEMYSECLHYEKIEGWQEFSDKAATIYDEMNIVPRRAIIGIFRSMVKFVEHDYEGALRILLHERSEIEGKNSFIDPMTRLDFDYTEAVLHFAVGNSEDAIRIMESAIEFSREKQVFYRIDHLYRLATFHAMMHLDEEKRKYYTKKIALFGEFADDKVAILYTNFVEIHHLNSYKQSYEKALHLLELQLKKYEIPKIYLPFYHLEKGKALFGLNQFEKAVEYFHKMKIAEYMHHPFDLSIFYEGYAYFARCHLELGNPEEAFRVAQKAFDDISHMPNSPYKDFITETHKMICS